MTAPAKTRTAIWTGQSLAAGAGNTTSTWLDLSTMFEGEVNIRLTNGGTGPTVPAQVQVQIANNYNAGSPSLPTNFGGALQGTTVNSDITYFSFVIPMGVAALRLIAGSNTGQAVTVDADISAVNSIS